MLKVLKRILDFVDVESLFAILNNSIFLSILIWLV